MNIKGVFSVIIAVFLLTSCAQLATVRNVKPLAPSTASVSARSFPTEQEAQHDSEVALSRNLEIAATAFADLARDPSNVSAIQIYNYSVGRIDHSIMGDRGRGDTPNTSDGVVPYWSSHLEGARSERIVSSDHGAHQNQEGEEEVERILLLNLKQPNNGA
jgi:hypothetical protein